MLIIIFFLFNLLINIRTFEYNRLIYTAKLCKYSYKTSLNNYLIIHHNKTLDICFRGTKNLNDIYINLNIFPKSFLRDDIKVHRGFLYKYLSIRNSIINETNNIISKHKINDIYISGHSSGGALATIASLDFYYLYPEQIIKTITFGSPKIVNKAFAEEYKRCINNSIRIINKNDIIPYLPILPKNIYQHIEEPLILNNKNILRIYDNHATKSYIRNLKTSIQLLNL